MDILLSTRPTRKIAERIVQLGIDGVGPLDSASDLAERLLIQYEGDQQQVIEQLIRGESRLGFVGGFATGMGGLLTLPITIPSAIAISWILQARLAAAVAIVCECDPEDPAVRDKIIAAITGSDVDSDGGSAFSELLSLRSLKQLPGAALNTGVEIAKKKVVRRAARTGIKLISPRLLPLLSGAISGRVDAKACVETGERAVEIFSKSAP